MAKSKPRKKAPPKPERRRCAFCGRLTTVPSKQRYEDAPAGNTGGSRWAHAPRGVTVLPLCELAKRTRGVQYTVETLHRMGVITLEDDDDDDETAA